MEKNELWKWIFRSKNVHIIRFHIEDNSIKNNYENILQKI